MFARKLIQSINVLIAVALLALLAGVYWFAWRPLPTESGSIKAPIGKPVRVERDALCECASRCLN